MATEIKPYGLGIQYNPPCLFVFYNSVRTMIEKIVAHHGKKELPALPNKVPLGVIDPTVNLNAVSDKDLENAKQAMEVEFQKNKIAKDAPNFQYDVKKDFGAPVGLSDWDDDEDLSVVKEMKGLSSVPPQGLQSQALPVTAESTPATSSTFKASSLGPLPSLIPVPGNTMSKSKSRDALADDMDILLNGLDKTIDQKVSERKRSNPNLHSGFDEKISKSSSGSLTKSPTGSLGSLSRSNPTLVGDQFGKETRRSNPSLLGVSADEKSLERKKAKTPPAISSPTEPKKAILSELPVLSSNTSSLNGKGNDVQSRELVKPAVVPDSTSEIQECLEFEESDEEGEFQKLLLKLNPTKLKPKKSKIAKRSSLDEDDIQFSDDGLSSLGSLHNDDGF